MIRWNFENPTEALTRDPSRLQAAEHSELSCIITSPSTLAVENGVGLLRARTTTETLTRQLRRLEKQEHNMLQAYEFIQRQGQHLLEHPRASRGQRIDMGVFVNKQISPKHSRR